MSPSVFKRYVAGMVVLGCAFFAIPAQSFIGVAWQSGIGWLVAGCILMAVRRNQLSPRLAWWFLALGIFLNSTGIVVDYLSSHFLGFKESDSPQPADTFWLMLYPALVLGLSMLAHRRAAGHDWSTIVDATIVIVGLSLLSWVFVVSASLHESALSLIGLFVVVAYPVGDLAVLGVLVRLLLQSNMDRNRALYLITLGLTLFLFGDLSWVVIFRFNFVLSGLERTLLQSVFLAAYACFGAAAVHPDSRKISEPVPERTAGVSPGLLLILATTSLVPSALLLYQAHNGVVVNGVAIGVSSAGLFLLVVVRVVGLLRKVEIQARQLSLLSRIDELTGLYNRRAWMSELDIAIERARRCHSPLCVGLIDLDHFKSFNDTFGHPAGDKLLKAASTAWLETIRLPDVLGRYGGEEFILIAANTSLEGAARVLERLRQLMPSEQTFSSGLSLWDGTEGVETFLKRTDQALYCAKEQGRNRTCFAESLPHKDTSIGG